MIEGETLETGAPHVCGDCRTAPVLGVWQSAAGYYVGTRCSCGPYTRESGYYASEESAREALASGDYSRPKGWTLR